jgi:hypothetical protein
MSNLIIVYLNLKKYKIRLKSQELKKNYKIELEAQKLKKKYKSSLYLKN